MTDSPAPGTPQTPYKAYMATALSFLAVFAGFWISDDGPFTSKEFVSALVQSAIACGIIGGATFAMRNKAKVSPLRRR